MNEPKLSTCPCCGRETLRHTKTKFEVRFFVYSESVPKLGGHIGYRVQPDGLDYDQCLEEAGGCGEGFMPLESARIEDAVNKKLVLGGALEIMRVLRPIAKADAERAKDCEACGGKGSMQVHMNPIFGGMSGAPARCRDCGGTGKVIP